MYLNIKNGVLSTGKTLGLFKAIKNKNNGYNQMSHTCICITTKKLFYANIRISWRTS